MYGYILLNAAHVLSSGILCGFSRFLHPPLCALASLFPPPRSSVPGCDLVVLLYGPSLVGSLLIPVLGALPDCLIILFSGIGSGTAVRRCSQ